MFVILSPGTSNASRPWSPASATVVLTPSVTCAGWFAPTMASQALPRVCGKPAMKHGGGGGGVTQESLTVNGTPRAPRNCTESPAQ